MREKYSKLIESDANKEKSVDEIFDQKIPASCYMDLFEMFDFAQDNFGLAKFFESILINELNKMPRRSIAQAAEKVISKTDRIESSYNLVESINGYLRKAKEFGDSMIDSNLDRI